MKFKAFFIFQAALWCLVISVSGQPKSYISRYTPATYKAGPVISHIIKDHRDILYFATNKGIIEYDGSEFRIIQASNFSNIKYIRQAEDQTIYIGANNDFGRLVPDSIGSLYYQSIVPFASRPITEFNDIWQIEFLDEKVLFQSNYGGIFTWDGQEVSVIPIKDTYIFNIDGKLYGSSLGKYEFGYLIDRNIRTINGFEKLNKDVVWKSFSWGNGNHLLSTSENGLFWLNTKEEKIEVFDCEASDYLKKYWFFDGIRIDANTLALGTWNGGVIIINKSGDVLEAIDRESGLLANMVYHMALGASHDLWLGTSDGIARINLDSLSIPFEFDQQVEPKVVIRNIVVNGGRYIYNRPFGISNDHQADTVIRLKELPSTVTFQYAVPSIAGMDINYQTRLEGYDGAWNEWSPSFRKEYTGISQRGSYTFKVTARSAQGRVTNTDSIVIFIDVPWYHTSLKYLSLIPLSLLFIFLFIKIRTNRDKRTRLELEKIINERTSDLIEKQEHLEQVIKELKVSNSELDSFVYHTSHDLKAPLKSIIGLIQLSEKENFDNENIRLYLQMIEKSVLKLEEFIYAIIEYSMNAKGALKLELVDIEAIIEEVLEELKEFSHIKEINIKKSVSLQDPLISDPVRIKIILNNLITNAVKYSDMEKDDPFIHIAVMQEEDNVQIQVEDNGIGIYEEYHEKIFEMFFKASENSWGSGLGLYIIKETVENLKGTIKMTSKPGIGTTFHIELPMDQKSNV